MKGRAIVAEAWRQDEQHLARCTDGNVAFHAFASEGYGDGFGLEHFILCDSTERHLSAAPELSQEERQQSARAIAR